MPEAPEVQTVLTTLEKQIRNARIEKVEIFHEKLPENLGVHEFEKMLENQKILRFFRLGKYLGFETEEYDWIVHLRMEGKFFVFDSYPDPKDKHIHAIFSLSTGQYCAITIHVNSGACTSIRKQKISRPCHAFKM